MTTYGTICMLLDEGNSGYIGSLFTEAKNTIAAYMVAADALEEAGFPDDAMYARLLGGHEGGYVRSTSIVGDVNYRPLWSDKDA